MEYDHEVLMPLLSIVYNGFTPTLFVAKPLDVGLPKLGVFGALIWIKEVPMELFKIELLFYKQIAMPNETFNLLNWWVE